MTVNIDAWRTTVEQIVRWLADEEGQRRAWFGHGPEVSSPDEDFCQFFDDAAIEDFLRWPDIKLSARQRESGDRLLSLMRDLSDATPEHLDPSTLIDSPQWRQIREAAAKFYADLRAPVSSG